MKSIIKKIIPEYVIWIISSKLIKFNYFLTALLKNNFILLKLSLLFNNYYLREHKSFLCGSYIYNRNTFNNKFNEFHLRRNIHRLEKGMIMIPRRKEFGIRFILETVKIFKALNDNCSFERSEYSWSLNVLNEYFKIVKSQNVEFLKAKKIFLGLTKDSQHEFNMIPYENTKSFNIEFKEFYSFCKTNKSVRWFKNKRVDSNLIDRALQIATLSPSSCNRQPYRYIISNQDNTLTQKILDVSAGTIGWAPNVPSVAVLIGKQRSFSNIANRHSIYIDSTLSVMPFIMALKTLGLASCIINWADLRESEKRMKNILSLEDDEKVILSIAIGYPKENTKVAFSKRKNINEISSFI